MFLIKLIYRILYIFELQKKCLKIHVRKIIEFMNATWGSVKRKQEEVIQAFNDSPHLFKYNSFTVQIL